MWGREQTQFWIWHDSQTASAWRVNKKEKTCITIVCCIFAAIHCTYIWLFDTVAWAEQTLSHHCVVQSDQRPLQTIRHQKKRTEKCRFLSFFLYFFLFHYFLLKSNSDYNSIPFHWDTVEMLPRHWAIACRAVGIAIVENHNLTTVQLIN